MSFFSELSRKLGFTSDIDDREEEELEDDDLPEDEEEYEEDEEEERGASRFPNPFRSRQPKERVAEEAETPIPSRNTRRGNVIHDARLENRSSQNVEPSPYTHCERIVNVRQIEECREIIRYLLQGESILLNLENIDPKDCGRVVDLLSGAAFALQGRMIKVAHLSYLLAPENVEIVETDLYASGRAYR